MMCLRRVAIVTLLLIAVVSSACIELTTTNGDGGGAGGASTSSGSNMATDDCVEPYPSCAACEVCAGQRPEGKCASAYKACQGSKECVTLDACFHDCPKGGLECLSACLSMYPAGADVYQTYYVCMYCMECSTACASTIPCAG